MCHFFRLYEDAIKAATQGFPRRSRTRLGHPSDVTQTGQSRPSSSPPAFNPCITLCIVALRGTQGVKFAKVHDNQQVSQLPDRQTASYSIWVGVAAASVCVCVCVCAGDEPSSPHRV